jgi:DNA replication protein DnaC
MAVARSEPFRQAACPLGVCDGSGWILGPEDVARECECRAPRLKRSRVRGVASVIPSRYRGVSFDRPPVSDMARDPGAREALGAVRKYIEALEPNLAQGRGLWLTGGTGTGKTTLAMLVSKAALDSGQSVAIYSLPKLLARIRRTYESEPGGDSYLSFFERLTSVDLLHLDDLGVEKRSDWVLEQLYAVVNERYESQRAMIVTTNLAEPDLLEQIGERTVSRLLEMCGEPRVLFGEDHRSRYDEGREGPPGTVRQLT